MKLFALFFITLMLLLPADSRAFFGFGEERGEASGLDLRQGYDVNTVVTVTGRVVSLPQATEQKNVLIEVKSGDSTIYLSVGPETYWEKGGLKVSVNDEITAKGSRAEGKDGRWYLLTQRVSNRSTGAQLEVRDMHGTPLWSSRAARAETAAPRDAGRLRGGAPLRGGGMMRGGNILRGGGMMGGGMRH